MALPEYISGIRFYRTTGNGSFEASGSFTVADSLAVKFAIFSNDGNMRLALPSSPNPNFDNTQPVGKQNPKFYDEVYPISATAREQLQTAIINELLREREGSTSMDNTIPF